MCLVVLLGAIIFSWSQVKLDAESKEDQATPVGSDIRLSSAEQEDMYPAESGASSTNDVKAESVAFDPDTEGRCPVNLPSDCVGVTHTQGRTQESWHTSSAWDCCYVAREILLGLQEDGYELIKADFLDLSEDAWGCTVQSTEGEVLIIALIPQSLGKDVSPNNRLMITVTHIKVPDSQELEGS